MPHPLDRTFDALRGLAAPDELRRMAAEGKAPAGRPKCNSHIHLPPNFSAFESVEQAVAMAAEQHVRVLGVTNYYDHRVYGAFGDAARGRGVFPLFGLEIISLVEPLVRAGTLINDPNNPGRMYICGKGAVGVAAPSGRAAELLGAIRRNDTERMAEMVRRTAEVFVAAALDTGLDTDAVIDGIVERHGCLRDSVTLQERHIAQAFQEALFRLVPAGERPAALEKLYGKQSKCEPEDAVKIQGELRSNLLKSGRPAFVEETFLSFEQAHELILALEAIPCYPTLADGASPICEFETPVDRLVGELRGRNIHMAEFIPTRNTPEVLGEYVRAMRAAGVAVVGGTEHNTLSLIGLEPTCIGGAAVPDDVKDIFWEGMCVCAAHQLLRLYGEAGFVDGSGRPNTDYATAEDRIAAFAKLGAAAIQMYFEACGE